MVTTRTLLLPVDKTDETEVEVWLQAGKICFRMSSKTHATDRDSQIWQFLTDDPEFTRLEMGVTGRRGLVARWHSQAGDNASTFLGRIKRQSTGPMSAAYEEILRKMEAAQIALDHVDHAALNLQNRKRMLADAEPYPVERGIFERMRLFAQAHFEANSEAGRSGLEIHPEPDALSSNNERPASAIDFFGLSDAEWLQAEALALQKEAVERATSLDQTLAYVTEKCAAVRKP
jgi:hypothetical protein